MKKNEETKKRRIRVYPSYFFDVYSLTGSLEEVIKKLQNFPDDFKKHIELTKDSYKSLGNSVFERMAGEWESISEYKLETSYDGDGTNLEMQYFREETDAEVEQRIKKSTATKYRGLEWKNLDH